MIKWRDVILYTGKGNHDPDRRVEKTEAEWRKQLTPEQYRITRQKGTEAPGTGEFCSRYEPGQYNCI
ncbi:MAG: peptide-methionine (R)-S-oxide reductase, partial [Bacteroidota bacterium]